MPQPVFDIVIPSIGEPSLLLLLSSINDSSLTPANVYIVLRSCDSIKFNSTHFSFPIHILFSSNYGQVAQRQYGFSVAKSPIVIQLDSDCIVPSDMFLTLLNVFCQLEQVYGESIALSPAFIDTDGFMMFSSDSFLLRSFRFLYSVLSLLYPCNNLTAFGFNFPLNLPQNKISSSSSLFRSDWLPGGCVVHRSSNLINSNYYPFSGKAYSEDLFHSYLLSCNSVKLFCTYDSYVLTEPHPKVISLLDSVDNALIYFRTSRRFCRLTKTHQLFSFLILLPYIKAFILSPLFLLKRLLND